MTSNLKFILLLIIAACITSCGDSEEPTTTKSTIVDIALKDADFSVLSKALEQADLLATLSADGAMTLMAPTDAAFAKAGIDPTALSKEELKTVLMYHVIGTSIASTAIADGDTYVDVVLEGKRPTIPLSLLINKQDGQVTLNGTAKITKADVVATNGVLHAIDNVLLPPNLIDHLKGQAKTSMLLDALGKASGNLTETLATADKRYTIFAPSDAAFADIQDVVEGLTPEQLSEVLTYHVIEESSLLSGQLLDATVMTLGGQELIISTEGGITIKDQAGNIAKVITSDIKTTNGIIHMIDKVVMPALEQ